MFRILWIAFAFTNCAFADDPTPIEMEFVIVELNSETAAQPNQGLASFEVPEHWSFESSEWVDEVTRLRSDGVDVHIQRLTATAYNALPAHVEMMIDRSVCDDTDRDDGSREQVVLDVSCLATRKEDGSYRLDLSIRDEARDDAAWNEPLMQFIPSSEAGAPPSDVTSAQTTLTVLPGEWAIMGGMNTSSIDQVGVNEKRSRLTSTILIVRLTER